MENEWTWTFWKALLLQEIPAAGLCQDAAQESPFPKFENVGGGCSESNSVIVSVWVAFDASINASINIIFKLDNPFWINLLL